jgi:HlyD family secretion protein
VQQIEEALLAPNAALRFTPAVQDTAAPSGGSLISKILPRPPQSKQNNNGLDKNKKQQKVWTLQDGKPTAIAITTGATNGIFTQVTGGNIEPGTKLLVDLESKEK